MGKKHLKQLSYYELKTETFFVFRFGSLQKGHCSRLFGLLIVVAKTVSGKVSLKALSKFRFLLRGNKGQR